LQQRNIMAKERILVVDDEEDILELISYNLVRDGYQVMTAASGEVALAKARQEQPDLILLDLMLPGMDGLDVYRELRKKDATNQIPIIMVTAKTEDTDIITGLELGSDDYITKPFSPRVLSARVKAVLRRNKYEEPEETRILKIHDLVIDSARHEALIKGVPKALTASEFKILYFLARRPGWVFTRDQIISSIRGDDYPVTDRSVDVQIVGLRKKLGESGAYIQTVRGVGYRFKE
jgi:two-component system, OmpR family, alkaline phosphatase synthesis response regulator PhoP